MFSFRIHSNARKRRSPGRCFMFTWSNILQVLPFHRSSGLRLSYHSASHGIRPCVGLPVGLPGMSCLPPLSRLCVKGGRGYIGKRNLPVPSWHRIFYAVSRLARCSYGRSKFNPASSPTSQLCAFSPVSIAGIRL